MVNSPALTLGDVIPVEACTVDVVIPLLMVALFPTIKLEVTLLMAVIPVPVIEVDVIPDAVIMLPVNLFVLVIPVAVRGVAVIPVAVRVVVVIPLVCNVETPIVVVVMPVL